MGQFALGSGTFCTKSFAKGDFLLDYTGERLTAEEGDKRANQDYIYYFRHGNKRYWYVIY